MPSRYERTLPPAMQLALRLDRVTRGFAVAYAGCAILGLASALLRLAGYDYAMGFVPLFDLSREANVPTWVSALGLLWCALLLLTLRAADRRTGARTAAGWGVLAVAFLLLASDEAAMLHDTVDDVMNHLRTDGSALWGWGIPMGLLALVVAARSLALLRRLPPRVAAAMIGAGALYVGAALGLEVVGALWNAAHGKDAVYAMLTVPEEALEMTGVWLFMRTLARHLLAAHAGLAFGLAGAPATIRVPSAAPALEPAAIRARVVPSR